MEQQRGGGMGLRGQYLQTHHGGSCHGGTALSGGGMWILQVLEAYKEVFLRTRSFMNISKRLCWSFTLVLAFSTSTCDLLVIRLGLSIEYLASI